MSKTISLLKKHGLLATTAAAGLAVAAYASPSQAAEAAASPSAAEGTLGEVVVTARKVEESVQRVPVSVSVATSVQLREANVKDLRQLENISPGITIRENTADFLGSLIQIRGQGSALTTLLGDSSVGTYIDGVYIPRVSGLELLLADPDEVSRVEVLRGPQGTLFGRNTTGGAINVVTKSPNQSLGAYADVQVGNLHTVTYSLGANIPLADGAALRLSTLQEDRGGYATDSTGQKLGDIHAGVYKARLTVNPGGKFSFDLSALYQHAETHGPPYKLKELCGDPGVTCSALASPNGPIIGGLFTNYVATLPTAFGGLGLPAGCRTAAEGSPTCPTGSNAASKFAQAAQILRGYIGGDPFAVGGADNRETAGELGVVSLQGSYRFSDWLTVKSISGFVHGSRSSAIDFDGTPYELLNVATPNRSTTLSQEFQFTGSHGPISYIGGLYISRETGEDRSLSAAQVNPAATLLWTNSDAQVTNISKAVYGQATWQVTSNIRFTGGLRYTEESRENIARNHTGPSQDAGLDAPIVSITPGSPPTAVPAAPFTVCSLPVADLDNPAVCKATFKISYSNVSWLASVDWQVLANTMLYAKASTGFKAGGEQAAGNNVPASFTPFLPETSLAYETGVKSTFLDGRARINAAVWLTDYSNIQRNIIIPNGLGGVANVLQNAAKARLYGSEVEGTLIPVKGLTLTASVSYFHGEYLQYHNGNVDLTSQPYALSNGGFPDWTYTLGARYVVPTKTGDLSLALNFYHQSKSVAFNQALTATGTVCCTVRANPALTEYSPAFNDLSARISLNIDAWDATVALFGSNLTNEVVFQPASDQASLGYRAYIPEPPRTFGIEFKKRFGGG